MEKRERSTARSVPEDMILILDDDPAVRNSLKFSLEVEGFSVRTYSSGTELLKDADIPKDGCLVIDYKLPGKNGLDVLDELRHRHVSLPAILITSHPSAAVRHRADVAGAALIEKPLLSEALFQGIRAALAAPPHQC
jgi:two-component system, LuxR family, response regulator FixJ